jgi:hypothetical protein
VINALIGALERHVAEIEERKAKAEAAKSRRSARS